MNNVFWLLLQNTTVVLALIPVVWCYCLWRRHHPAEQNLLWLLLLLKLVLPPLWILEWPNTPEARTIPIADVEGSTVLAWDDGMLEETPQRNEFQATAQPTQATVVAAAESTPFAGRGVWVSSFSHALLVWTFAAGTALFAMATLHRLYRDLSLVRKSRPAPIELVQRASDMAKQMGMHPVALRVANGLSGPIVVWWGRSLLIWPATSASAHDASWSGALAHELAHVRRRDHFAAWLEVLASLCQWWNPVFWYVRRRVHETRELACDAMALEHSGLSRVAYVELLMELTTGHDFRVTSLPTVGLGAISKASLKRRIAMIFEKKVTGRLSLASMFVATCLASTLVLAAKQTRGQSADPSGLPEASLPAVTDPHTPKQTRLSSPTFESKPGPFAENPSSGRAGAANPFDPPVSSFGSAPELPEGMADKIRKAIVEVIEKEIPASMKESQPDAANSRRQMYERMIVKWLQSTIESDGKDHQTARSAPVAVNPLSRNAAPRAGAEEPSANVEPLQYEVELAEITLQEKQVELESLQSEFEIVAQAAKGNSISRSEYNRAEQKVKLAQLAIRKAKVNLEKTKAALAAEVRSGSQAGTLRTH